MHLEAVDQGWLQALAGDGQSGLAADGAR